MRELTSLLLSVGETQVKLRRVRVRLVAGIALAGLCCSQVTAQAMPVFGIVRDLAGEPVANATVWEVRPELDGVDNLTASRLGLGRRYGASTTTNKLGKFLLRVSGHDSFGIVAVRGDRERSQAIAPAAPGGNYDLTLYPLTPIKGRFVDVLGDVETPARGRMVRSMGPIESGIAGDGQLVRVLATIDEATTDDEGRFTLLVANGVPGRLVGRWGKAKCDIAGDLATEFLIKRTLWRAYGEVVNANGRKPLTTARLHLDGATIPVDSKGVFDVGVQTGHSLMITAPGFQPHVVRSEDGYDVEMIPVARAELVVRNADGSVVKGAAFVSCTVASSVRGSSIAIAQHAADASGKLVLSRGTQYGTTLWLRQAERLVRVYELPAGIEDARDEVQIATFSVQGTVLGGDGILAAHVPVFASPSNPVLGSRWPLASKPVAYTDHAGKFTIPALANLEYVLAAKSAQSFVTFTELFQPKGQAKVSLQLEAAPVISGSVLGLDRKPASGVTVMAQAKGKIDERLQHFGLWGNSAVTDEKGRFVVPLVAAGMRHELRAYHPQGNAHSRPLIVEGAEEDVVLPLLR